MGRHTKLVSALVLAVGLLVSTTAFAQEGASSDHAAADNSVVVAPHVGALFPQVTSDLDSWAVFGLSGGYILPGEMLGFERPLELGLDVMYTQPGGSGGGHEPNLGEDGSDYSWDLTQRMVVLEAYGLWRFKPAGGSFSPYAHIGPRTYLMETEVDAVTEEGEDFGTNTEQKTEFGFVFGGGADFAVGPGTMYGTLEFGWNNLDQRISGDTAVGALALDVGYRLFF
ncbi:MAG: outer membrane beta-barrel protein [Persicimonas sp.]